MSAVDTTAAGDTFTGYFIAGLSKGLDVPKILRYASAASAIAVSRKGAASSIPSFEEVEVMIDSLPSSSIDSQKEREELVKSFITAHVSDIKLADVAKLLGYNEDHAGRWIQKCFGVSFSELLQKERCRMAAELLQNTEMTVEEVIEKVGYSNGSFFRKIFAEYYQMSPKEYRKKFR